MLTGALAKQSGIVRVDRGLDHFWTGPLDADVVHIQWPENLFEWREPSVSDLAKLEAMLARWKARAVLVVTVHNRYPHYRNTSLFERLYRLVYGYTDGIIHMGHASVAELAATHPELDHKPRAVIPLGDYTCFPNVVGRVEARRILGVGPRQYVVLFLGSLRHTEETRLLLEGFRATQVRRKRLIIAGRVALSRHRLVRVVRRARLTLDPRIILRQGFIPDDQVQHYANASDVVVIPRVQILNSSSVSLGFTFGKVVVGPRTGVVGEILSDTGNPTFAPQDALSLAEALEHAQVLSAEGKGESNREHARRYWSWDHVAAQHVEFYERLRSTAFSGVERAAGAEGCEHG
jgi:glycosyltransferase involved in cell wall biosynthesis